MFEVDTEECEKKETHNNNRTKLAATLFRAHLFTTKKGEPILYELCKLGGKVRINDVKARVFRDLLRYLYRVELDEHALGKMRENSSMSLTDMALCT